MKIRPVGAKVLQVVRRTDRKIWRTQ